MKHFSKKTIKAEIPERPRYKYDPQPYDQAEERGKKEVSQYDEEYEFLIKLIKLISKAAPEAVPEIKALSQSFPFVTIDDVGDLAAKIWTLATEKYNIPRDWLIEKLDKHANLVKKAYTTDLTQFALDDKQIQQHFESRGLDVADVVSSLPNFSIKYINKDLEKKDPSLKDNTNGFYDYTSGILYINPRLSVDDKRITIIHEIEHAIQDSVGMLPVHTPEDLKQVQKTPYLERTFEMGARQQQFNALKARGMSLEDIEKYWIKRYKVPEFALEEVRNELEQYNELSEEIMPGSILASKKKADLWPAQEQAGDMLSHEHNSLSYNNEQEADTSVSGPRPDEVDKVSKSKKLNINDVVKILNAKEPQVANINTKERTLQLIDGTTLSFDDAIKKVMEMEKTGLFSGAEFSTTEFNVNPTLDNGPFSSPQDEGAGDQVQPWPNTEWVPADDKNEDEEPPSNVASNLKRPFSKKADLSGQTVNTILNDIHSSGTATYNMLDGDMQGTHNFAISAFPERNQSSPEGVDFDTVEKYLLANEDLLKDSNNAFRAIMQNGQVQLQIVTTVPDRDQAIELAKQYNQPTISDLLSNQDIPTGGIGEVNKTADENVLSQSDQDEIAAASSPIYNIAINNFADAVKTGHDQKRALKYAIQSVANIEKIDEKKLVEFINTYL